MAPFFDQTEILGGKATVYRRSKNGSFYWRYWVPAEKTRVSKSLKTKDLGVAVQLATEQTLDAMSRERSGVRVVSGTIRDAINAYEAKQMARLKRGEIRSIKKQSQNVDDLRSNCEATWGLDTPLSSMTQERWNEYIDARPDIKLSTLKSHLNNMRSLVKNHGLTLGAPIVPNFDHVVVPKKEKARRNSALTEEEFEALVHSLIDFMRPEDGEKRKYKRDFNLHGHNRTGKGNRYGVIDQKKEKHIRVLLYRFVMVLASSGLRPHEAAGYKDKSLRLRDIADPGWTVESKQVNTRERPVVLLSIREDTKTGKRIVPAVCGDVIEKIKERHCVDQSPDAPLFQTLDGKPMTLGKFRIYFNEAVRRCKAIDRNVDLYELRHLYITRRLTEGVPVTTVANTVGSSVNLITTTYAHILMTTEDTAKSLYEQQLRRGEVG